MSDLLKFADQCEAVECGSFGLDKAILAALGFTWRGMNYWSSDDKTMWNGRVDFTSSIDAAITLIPKGWTRVIDASAPEHGIDVDLFPPDNLAKKIRDVKGSSLREPLAICAAALRARSRVDVGGSPTPSAPAASAPGQRPRE